MSFLMDQLHQEATPVLFQKARSLDVSVPKRGSATYREVTGTRLLQFQNQKYGTGHLPRHTRTTSKSYRLSASCCIGAEIIKGWHSTAFSLQSGASGTGIAWHRGGVSPHPARHPSSFRTFGCRAIVLANRRLLTSALGQGDDAGRCRTLHSKRGPHTLLSCRSELF